jgi:hypothetical protein
MTLHMKKPAAGGAAGLENASLPGGIDCRSNAPKTAPGASAILYPAAPPTWGRAMSVSSAYPACLTKRNRATKTEMQLRLAGLRGIVEAMRPMTVRQVFYQATVHHIVEKTEQGYDKVQIALANMRRAGAMRRAVTALRRCCVMKSHSGGRTRRRQTPTSKF